MPANGVLALVIGSIAASSGAAIEVSAGTAIMSGLTIPAGATLAAIAALILIALLIIGIVQYLLDKLPPRYQIFRHYTTLAGRQGILSGGCIDPSGWFGNLIIPGTYITDLLVNPTSTENREYIAQELRIPYDKTEAYVQMKIDVNKVQGLINLVFIFPHQYLYPDYYGPLCHQPPRIIFDGLP